ncbi:DUF3644 domain-containing protein [Edwardsiella ictaluri]|uniref:DUF3644 domain-containing protein n=4 Tax=Edwardsiella ictaluri TaxID=67780 RepID=C5BEQ5_EDWI9|nr:DUF3644 domain-containing protein [Edwardsiella ictaluri]ACR70293.1 hypothetical protein NT01EI_3143 [Edwardsiella ictaluri 93-146]AVZ82841.1 DUF3644 domain-containing protein [Edwardsiella ictaluri]EKS7762493.1 DUF3644 domain-containing protein [Edwardsiella ictaluri]EKS7770443.1 DUF3644 domain-containing protein [Edwardsiella ictaluri]EKS7773585.1 DUF3644 domain-containing protein [Edwardsiella ictaluri]
MRLTKAVKAFYYFLQDKERSNSSFSESEILEVTKWKKTTFKTYYGKGQLADFVSESDDGKFEASNTLKISDTEFAKQLSQSKNVIALGHNCKSKLAKALLKKSRDNMMLALELYNRPSLENKMDAFVMCFCTSWEQFLKAKIIEVYGEKTIFRRTRSKGLKETISLRECLDKIYPPDSNIRRNIEEIAYYRDCAVHLLMPEIQCIVSRIFQSGVLNFTSQFEEFTKVSFLKNSHVGMISLVGEFKSPPVAIMKSTYGEIADDILALTNSLYSAMEDNDNIEFAIPLNVRLVYVKDDREGSSVILTKADEGIEGLKKVLFIEKPIERSKTHPLTQTDAIRRINEKLHEKYDEAKLAKCLVCKSSNGRYIINRNCFLSVLKKTGWANANNEYHYKNEKPEYHYYSLKLVDAFINKILEHDRYLKNAKDLYNRCRGK